MSAPKSSLFQYAVMYHPIAKKDDDPLKSELLVDVTTVLATSSQEVAMLAAREIPTSHTDRLDRVEIIVRPF